MHVLTIVFQIIQNLNWILWHWTRKKSKSTEMKFETLLYVVEFLDWPSALVMYEIEFWAQKIRDRNFFNLGKYFETNLCEFLLQRKVFLWMTTFFQGAVPTQRSGVLHGIDWSWRKRSCSVMLFYRKFSQYLKTIHRYHIPYVSFFPVWIL